MIEHPWWSLWWWESGPVHNEQPVIAAAAPPPPPAPGIHAVKSEFEFDIVEVPIPYPEEWVDMILGMCVGCILVYVILVAVRQCMTVIDKVLNIIGYIITFLIFLIIVILGGYTFLFCSKNFNYCFATCSHVFTTYVPWIGKWTNLVLDTVRPVITWGFRKNAG